MNTIFIGLVPALMWGLQPLVMQKIGGKPTNQQMGMAMGTLLFSILIFFVHPPTHWDMRMLLAGILCGVSWAFGQINQIKSVHIIGVSKAMPISTGTQLIGTSLIGIVVFREWTTPIQFSLGIPALLLFILGVSFTAYQKKSTTLTHSAEHVSMAKGVFILILSSIGYIMYAVIPRIVGLDAWDALIPQALGIFFGSILFCSFEKSPGLFEKKSFANILTGLLWAIGNIALMVSNQKNGVALGFSLAQMSVIVATLGGMIILHEKKSSHETKITLTGLLFIVIGGLLIGMTK